MPTVLREGPILPVADTQIGSEPLGRSGAQVRLTLRLSRIMVLVLRVFTLAGRVATTDQVASLSISKEP
jgi:hypothetical protein